MGPETVPRITKTINSSRPTAERIIPAMAIPFPDDFKPRKPNTMPTTLIGPPQNQNTEAHNERMPSTNEAMARPFLSPAGAGAGIGAGMGGSCSDIISPLNVDRICQFISQIQKYINSQRPAYLYTRKQKTNRVTEYCVPRSTTQWREGVLRKYLDQASSIYERFGQIHFEYLGKKQ